MQDGVPRKLVTHQSRLCRALKSVRESRDSHHRCGPSQNATEG